MGCKRMGSRYNRAVSEVVGITLVLMIATTAVSAILFWAIPQMEERKNAERAENALTQFKAIDEAIKNLISQGVNSSNNLDFVIDKGYFSLSSTGERFILYYSIDSSFNFNVSGFDPDDSSYNSYKFHIDISKGTVNQVDVFWPTQGMSEINIPISIWGDVTVSKNELSDAVRIDVTEHPAGMDKVVKGKIWVFDVGSITFETSSQSQEYKMYIENGGVISSTPSNGYMMKEPNIYNSNDSFVMRIIKVSTEDTMAGSGEATYELNVKVTNNSVLTTKDEFYNCFKMQIYGDDAAVSAWKLFLKTNHGFEQFPDDGATPSFDESDIWYIKDGKMFTLTFSICNIILGVS